MALKFNSEGIDRVTADLSAYADRVDALGDDFVGIVYAQAAESIDPLVQESLAENLNSSGIKTRTGKLAQAVSNATVSARKTAKGVSIIIAMPASVGKYSGKNAGFYKAAAALNYGAVRVPKVYRQTAGAVGGSTIGRGVQRKKAPAVGEKAKRTIKKYAIGGGVSDRAIGAVERDIRFGGVLSRRSFHIGSKVRESDTSVSLSGGAVVIKPHKYFYLTESQKEAIVTAFFNRAGKLLAEALGL